MGTVFTVGVYHSAISIIMKSLGLQLLVLLVTVASTATIGDTAIIPSPSVGYPIEFGGTIFRLADNDLHNRSLSLGRPICYSQADCLKLNWLMSINNTDSHSLSKRSPVNPITFIPAAPKLVKSAIAAVGICVAPPPGGIPCFLVVAAAAKKAFLAAIPGK